MGSPLSDISSKIYFNHYENVYTYNNIRKHRTKPTQGYVTDNDI